MAWKIEGRGGRLRAGSRPAASFGKWDASRLEDGRWRISAEIRESDAYWLENGTTFTGILEMGKTGGVRAPAEIVSTDPLVFDMAIEE